MRESMTDKSQTLRDIQHRIDVACRDYLIGVCAACNRLAPSSAETTDAQTWFISRTLLPTGLLRSLSALFPARTRQPIALPRPNFQWPSR